MLNINPDADLFVMIKRHDHAWTRMDDLYAAEGDAAVDTPEYEAASRETIDLELRIAAYPVQSLDGQTAKLAFLSRYPEVVDLGLKALLATILTLDADRIAAAS